MRSSFLSLSLAQQLTHWLALYRPWAFGLVALIVFAETGLMFAPFLPGDSLLFESMQCPPAPDSLRARYNQPRSINTALAWA